MPDDIGRTAENFFYELPRNLIAQDPIDRRVDSRLLLVEPDCGVRGEIVFRELVSQLREGDLLVLNDSRVLPARLHLRRVDTEGRIEVLLVRPLDADSWLAMARPVRRLRPGQGLKLTDPRGDDLPGPMLEIAGVRDGGFIEIACPGRDLAQVAEDFGEIPLPPYIERDPDAPDNRQRCRRDRRRYQNVFAGRQAGSVAAPTAGLHFDADLLSELAAAGVETTRVKLHVGPGTFKPPSEEQIRVGRLHGEVFHYDAGTDEALRRARAAGGRIIAVGTTSLRVLETVARLDLASRTEEALEWPASESAAPVFTGPARRSDKGWNVSGTTRLFIQPPERIESVDGLLTNFHLPGSSLLMLVACLAGESAWRRAYEHAVNEKFRFYSYGDAMLILPGGKG